MSTMTSNEHIETPASLGDNRVQRFLNSKLVPAGQLGDGGEGIMSQKEFDDFVALAKIIKFESSEHQTEDF